MLEMKYFVLKPKGNDPYAQASRDAIRTYAECIRNENLELSDDLLDWVNEIEEELNECEIEIELPDDYFLYLAKQAHEKDITFNQHVNNILKEELEEDDNDDEFFEKLAKEKRFEFFKNAEIPEY